MSIEKNIQTVKDFFAAIAHGAKAGLLALVAEDIEWIIPGENWALVECPGALTMKRLSGTTVHS